MYLFDYAFTRTRSVSTSLILDTCQEPGGGGDSYMEQTGMLVGNFEFKP